MTITQAADPTTDEVLIGRSIEGDERAFASLVERYQRKIYRTAFAIVRDEMEADLVTQDTFVQAYMNLAKFEQRSGFETWLTRIAINRSRDSLRSRRWSFVPWRTRDSSEEGEVIEVVDERPDAERQALSSEFGRELERAMEGLSEQQRMIFRLRHFEDLALEEIARLTSLRPATVRVHLFRAIHKIRQQMRSWTLNPGARP